MRRCPSTPGPRAYLVYAACNSGARIGLADELKPKFRWPGSTRRTPRPATITCT